MSVVTIPFDFDRGCYRRSFVPSCISTAIDADGQHIAPGVDWRRSFPSRTICADSRAKE